MTSQDGKHLISNIQSQYPKLSKGQKLIAQYILSNYDKAAFMTASKLGETVGVSESTVVRFANVLGFSGYPKLQASLQELIKNKLTTVQRVEMANEYSSDHIILNKVLKSDIENIRETLEEMDEQVFQEAVNKVLHARKIYIIGMRSSFAIAQYLGFYLNVILDNVHVVRADIGDAYEQMVRINEDDVVIAMSFPRYSKKTYQVVSYAKSKGAKIISMTDSLFAPVSSLSHHTLLMRSNMASFVDSLVAPLSVINALIIAVGMREKEEIKSYFDDLEHIWKQYDIYE